MLVSALSDHRLGGLCASPESSLQQPGHARTLSAGDRAARRVDEKVHEQLIDGKRLLQIHVAGEWLQVNSA